MLVDVQVDMAAVAMSDVSVLRVHVVMMRTIHRQVSPIFSKLVLTGHTAITPSSNSSIVQQPVCTVDARLHVYARICMAWEG